MKLAKTGDIYFPGSSDFMEKAKTEGLVYSETERIPLYLVTSINVQKGNPKNIHTLKDLLKPGLRLAIANPENVCVGTYAVEVVEKNLSPAERAQFRKNLVNYTESCDKTATVVAMKSVDAVIGWEVFQYWNPEEIETIDLKPAEIVRVGYIPIAISKYSQNTALAQQFIDFIMGDEARSIFKKYRYFTSPEEAFEYIGEVKPVGGVYNLPKEWILE
jgi:molybdate transport system substrate-binding protein